MQKLQFLSITAVIVILVANTLIMGAIVYELDKIRRDYEQMTLWRFAVQQESHRDFMDFDRVEKRIAKLDLRIKNALRLQAGGSPKYSDRSRSDAN